MLSWGRLLRIRAQAKTTFYWHRNHTSALPVYTIQTMKSTHVRTNRAPGSLIVDERTHAGFLHCALSNGAHSGRMTYEAALIILEEIRVSVPKMLRIWANTPLSQGGRDGVLSKAMAMESRLAEKIGKGVISKDGVLSIRDFDT